jgi:hypothetical protein
VRRLIAGGLVLVAVAGLVACDRRGGRRVLLMPEEIAGRHDTEWRITQEPTSGVAPPPADAPPPD